MRITIADDHPLMRRGVIDVVHASLPAVEFDEANDAAGLFAKLRVVRPDLVILDLSLPDRHGLDCLAEITRRYVGLPVLILSMHAEHTFGLRALDQGAMGYLTKDRAVQDIVTAIERIAAGRRYVGLDLAEAVIARRAEGQVAHHERLSAREFRVMCALARGDSLASIATQLTLSPKTVTTYRARVLTKLEVHSNAELVRYCVVHKLID